MTKIDNRCKCGKEITFPEKVRIVCECGENHDLDSVTISEDKVDLTLPVNKGSKTPIGVIPYWLFTDEELTSWVEGRINKILGTSIKILHATLFPERKDKNINNYAHSALLLVMPTEILTKNEDMPEYVIRASKINGSPQLVPKIRERIIKRYSYNRTQINELKRNYKYQDTINRQFGLNISAFLGDKLANLLEPKVIKVSEDEAFVAFVANPIEIVRHILEDETGNMEEPGNHVIKMVTERVGQNSGHFTVFTSRNVSHNRRAQDNIQKVLKIISN